MTALSEVHGVVSCCHTPAALSRDDPAVWFRRCRNYALGSTVVVAWAVKMAQTPAGVLWWFIVPLWASGVIACLLSGLPPRKRVMSAIAGLPRREMVAIVGVLLTATAGGTR